MADFKKLSAVEKVESAKDSATVLIEEDGIIKRMPNVMQTTQIVDPYAAYDLVLVVDNSYTIINLIKGDYQTLYNKFVNYELINIYAVMFYTDGGIPATMVPLFRETYRIELNEEYILITSTDGSYPNVIMLYPDNRVIVTSFD